jgi:hypothetical protein
MVARGGIESPTRGFLVQISNQLNLTLIDDRSLARGEASKKRAQSLSPGQKNAVLL